MRDNIHTFTQTRRAMDRQAWANRMTPVVLEVLGEPMTAKDELTAFGIICGAVAVFLVLACAVMA